jgi:hypothetical protein
MRAPVVVAALYVVALGLVFLAIGDWRISGLVDLMRELGRGLDYYYFPACVSLALALLSAWITHALGTGLVRWLGCDGVDIRDGYRCTNTAISAAFDFAVGIAMATAYTWPFSAGLVLFALGFPAIMLVRGVLRIVRRAIG